MNKITKLFLLIFLFSYSPNAQLIVGESGSIEVKNGASIEVAGLEINPAADYVINSSTSVTGDLAPVTINGAESMDRHYDIVAPLSDFIGTIVFNYNEEDMNGVTHVADLQVLDSDGGSWTAYSDTDDTDFSVTHVFDSSVNIHSVTASAVASSGCDYTLTLNDQYNDGWTNSDGSANNIDVLVNGVVVSNHTISGGSESFAIAASYGDVVSLSYNVAGSGNWAGENSFVVTDADGATVTSGNSSSNGESFECLDPNQVNLDRKSVV